MNTFVKCGKENLSLSIFESARKSDKFLILCFGGSKTNFKERYKDWQKVLAENGINSASFDYSGTGKSTGNFTDSSLSKRIDETSCIINWAYNNYGESLGLHLLGESMGAYVALGAANKNLEIVKKIVLMVPAAYSSAAHSLLFNRQFTEEIRKDRSWRDSLSFDWLKAFPGETLILASAKDAVIPSGVLEEYKICVNKKQPRFIQIPDAPHGIWGEYVISSVRENFLRHIISFLKN